MLKKNDPKEWYSLHTAAAPAIPAAVSFVQSNKTFILPGDA